MESKYLAKAIILTCMILLVYQGIPQATALTYTDDETFEFIFQQGTTPDLTITCEDTNDFPCPSNFACNITVGYPNNSLLISNQRTTYQGDHYNITLPTTDTLGIHTYAAFCTNGTHGGIASELQYLVNLTGEEFTLSKAIIYIFILILTVVLMLLSLFGAIKIPWKHKTDDDGFIVGMNDLKYVKLILWFVTYMFFLFATWMTHTVARFLELGMAANFFNFIYLFLLVFVFPTFVVLFVKGFASFFNDRKLDAMFSRNLRVR